MPNLFRHPIRQLQNRYAKHLFGGILKQVQHDRLILSNTGNYKSRVAQENFFCIHEQLFCFQETVHSTKAKTNSSQDKPKHSHEKPKYPQEKAKYPQEKPKYQHEKPKYQHEKAKHLHEKPKYPHEKAKHPHDILKDLQENCYAPQEIATLCERIWVEWERNRKTVGKNSIIGSVN